jgi:two-component system, cell cycle response regulator DivK
MQKQILFIDRDISSYILVSEILLSFNVKITHCKCGTSATIIFKKYPDFDLVITEIKLPGLDGFKVLNEIRNINPNIPIIAQTASVCNNMEKRCLDAGFNEFVAKPININRFAAKVIKYISNNCLKVSIG